MGTSPLAVPINPLELALSLQNRLDQEEAKNHDGFIPGIALDNVWNRQGKSSRLTFTFS